MPILEETGYAIVDSFDGAVDPAQWLNLEYLPWDDEAGIRFAPLSSADGSLTCDGFWMSNPPRSDKDGTLIESQRAVAPTLVNRIEAIGARAGRCRVIELQPNSYSDTIYGMHNDPNNYLNPEGEGWVVRCFMQLTDDPGSFMVLRRDIDDPSTETRIPMPVGRQLVVDSQRMWHGVWHTGNQPRYCVVASVESGPALDEWIHQRHPITSIEQQPLDSTFAQAMEHDAQQRRAARDARQRTK